MKLWIIALIIFILNLPFGYWRANVKKFSVQWFLAIHIPVPFIILLRIYGGLGFELITYPILLGADFLGQVAGGKIHSHWVKTAKEKLTSCMFVEFFRKS